MRSPYIANPEVIGIDAPKESKDEKMVRRMCICKKCPTYNFCFEKVGFCHDAVGKSACIKKERGCICASCPVLKEFNMVHAYFCIRGSENKQSETIVNV